MILVLVARLLLFEGHNLQCRFRSNHVEFGNGRVEPDDLRLGLNLRVRLSLSLLDDAIKRGGQSDRVQRLDRQRDSIFVRVDNA